ncbi:MAG: hypothetical protein V4498_05600 [candidate division FCPU426 bacterium]
MKKPFKILAFLLAWPSLAIATAGADFLLLDLNAKSLAQAGAMGAGSQGLSQLRHNPSSLGQFRRFEASLTHVEAFGEWTHDLLALEEPSSVGNFAVEFQWSRIKPFTYYDANGDEAGTLQAGTQLLGLAWAGRSASKQFGVGLRLKGFLSQLAEYGNWGYAIDIGLDARSKTGLFNVALSLHNLGEQTTFYQYREELPLYFCFSSALESDPSAQLGFRLAADLLSFADSYHPFEIRLGGQASVLKLLQLRAGMRFQSSQWSPSFGGGIKLKFGEISYALMPDNFLGLTHALTLEVWP